MVRGQRARQLFSRSYSTTFLQRAPGIRPIPADTKALWPRLLDPSALHSVRIAVFAFLYCRVEVIFDAVGDGAACDSGACIPCYLIK